MSGADFYYCPDVHGEYITPLSIFPERSEYFYENFVFSKRLHFFYLYISMVSHYFLNIRQKKDKH